MTIATEPRYFCIPNWDEFQHYKDRSPPWIKLYNNLLEDYEFSNLSDASKLHLIAIWLLASRTNNKIPLDSDWVCGKASVSGPIDFAELEKANFISSINGVAIGLQDASIMLDQRERESRAEQRENSSKRESQFNEFWGVFAYKNGRVPALKAWGKISGYDDALFVQILAGAKRDAAARPDLTARGITPKMAQGWITDRRWEDEIPPVTTPIGPQAMLG